MLTRTIGLSMRLWAGILLLLAMTSSGLAQDLMMPITISAEKPAEFPIADLYFASGYQPHFTPPAGMEVRYSALRKTVTFRASTANEGYQTVMILDGGTKKVLPVRVVIKPTYTFRFKPDKSVRRVNVFGSFNTWNREISPLTDPDGDGVYETTLALDPGSYEYKFFVDGEEILDPGNPTKVPNGFGGFNALLSIKPRHTAQLSLDVVRQSGRQFTFRADHSDPHVQLARKHVLALIDNAVLPAAGVRISGRECSVSLPAWAQKGAHTLRIVLTVNGQTSNLQTVFLQDGKPRGNASPGFVWQDARMYSVMTDRFKDGNPANNQPVLSDSLRPEVNYRGGDFQGILDQLNSGYFDQLGVNVLWLSPVVNNPDGAFGKSAISQSKFAAYHGYWPIAEKDVEAHFGDMALLKKVVQTAHAKGMKVILDFVAHHVHVDHPWFKQHPEWFGALYLPDGRRNIELWDEQRLTTWFDTFLPTFDFLANPAAIEAASDNALWWLKETGVDGFRQDAVKHVPNEFWRALTRKMRLEAEKTGRSYYQIGETFGSNELIKSYVNSGQLDGQFNFNLFYRARSIFLNPQSDFQLLAAELQSTHETFGVNHLMGNLMDSHDQVRYMAYTDGDFTLDSPDVGRRAWFDQPQVDHPESYQKAQLYFAYLMTIPGIPTIYYGDEIGMTGSSDPDNRRMMRFGADLTPNERQMLAQMQQIARLRQQLPALRYGDFRVLTAHETAFAYMRSDFNQRVVVALNRQDKNDWVEVSVPSFIGATALRNVVTNERVMVSSAGRARIPLGAQGWGVYEVVSNR